MGEEGRLKGPVNVVAQRDVDIGRYVGLRGLGRCPLDQLLIAAILRGELDRETSRTYGTTSTQAPRRRSLKRFEREADP